jgi:hypothetical protein
MVKDLVKAFEKTSLSKTETQKKSKGKARLRWQIDEDILCYFPAGDDEVHVF